MRPKYSHYMRQAIELAKRSVMEQKHGCVVIHNNEVVAQGVNEHIYNQEDRNVFSIHSEQSALSCLLAMKNHNHNFIKNCVVFVARVGPVSKGYPIRLSKPCKRCQTLLHKVGIRRVFYTVDDHTMQELTTWDL